LSEDIEWDVCVPLVSNIYILVDMLIILILLSMALAGVVIYLTGFSHIYDVFRLFIIGDGVVIILLLFVMSLVFLNRFHLIYRLNDEGVHVRVGEFESSLNRAAWRISGLAQRWPYSRGFTPILLNEELYVPWSSVKRFFSDPKRRVVTLTDGLRPLMRIYCTEENVNEVFSLVETLVPEPEE